ncbi:MAG TPA: hypothetical protein VIL86_15210 [Tepidisphaeraceae bacterium]|jgi:hypothetical protein
MMRFMAMAVAAAGGLVVLGAGQLAHGQVNPFFSRTPIVFEPQIEVVNSGAILDAAAVVSNDRKYVTITARPSNTRLLALQQFVFMTDNPPGGPGGLVGQTPIQQGNNNALIVNPSPQAIQENAGGNLLEKQGMVKLKLK